MSGKISTLQTSEMDTSKSHCSCLLSTSCPQTKAHEDKVVRLMKAGISHLQFTLVDFTDLFDGEIL